MSIRCPHCEHKFALKAAAGVYQPKCPDCGETFALAIPREAGGKAIAAKTVEQLKRYQAKHSDKTAHPPAAPNANAASAADMPTVASSPADQPTVASAPVDMPTVATPPASAGAPYDQPTVGAGPAPAASETDGEPLARLDGYELLRELGRGGMGCVYLARQLSLDRHVAVKTIAPQLARSPAFLARFVREAFAVAQLSHHNVVQIHDVGHEDDQHYFSMEFVQGRSLSDIVKANGPLPPQQAVTYTLHAARGLAFAHEHQMVHRDVKPANLLLNDQGLVKVADLGLVKTADAEGTTKAELEQAKAMAGEAGDSAAGTHVTKGGAAMGTPAFMAPEQAKDAAAVDARADIYALGATLYYLLTGKPPLPARSADELLKLHATVGIKPPAARVPAVPEKLSAVVMKMLAKRPGDRFATMAEVVAQLEALMGVSAKAFTPAQQHADQLEHAVERYNQSAPAKVRRGGYIAFHIVALLLTAAGIILGNYILTGTTVWAWACTTAGYLLLSGMVNRGDLSRSVRQYLYQIGWVQWVMLAGGIASFTVMAVVLGLILYFLAATAVGLGLAAGYAFIVDRWVAKDRAPAVAQVRKVLRDMRLRGQDEKHIRRFVCAYSGRDWEPLYEALFGYTQMRDARKHWGFDQDGNARPHHAGWRDGIYDWLGRQEQERETARRRAHLQRAELQKLRAQGVSDMDAMAQARQHARDWFEAADLYQQTGTRDALARIYLDRDLTEAEAKEARGYQPGDPIPESWKLRPTPISTRVAYWFLAARARALAGGLMLVAWAYWATRREKLPMLPEDGGYLEHLRSYLLANREPLTLPPIPPAVTDVLCSQTTLLAGLILVWAGLYRGVRLTLFILPIVVMLLRAPFMDHAMWGPLYQQEWVILLALAMTPPAFFFGKSDY